MKYLKSNYHFIILILFFSSCIDSNIRFLEPQPTSLESLNKIPDKFHGEFIIEEDTIILNDYTIDGDTINTDSLIVKTWGNYLFINQLVDDVDSAFYRVACGKLVNTWGNEEISLHYFNIDLEFQGCMATVKDTIEDSNNYSRNDAALMQWFFDNMNSKSKDIYAENIIGITKGNDFILDNINLNQFQSLLNSSKSKTVKRIK